MSFHSSLGVLLCELRPDIDTLLCSIGLECVQKKILSLFGFFRPPKKVHIFVLWKILSWMAYKLVISKIYFFSMFAQSSLSNRNSSPKKISGSDECISRLKCFFSTYGATIKVGTQTKGTSPRNLVILFSCIIINKYLFN